MKNKKMNLSFGLILLALNSNVIVMQILVLLGITLILSYSKERDDKRLNNLCFVLAISVVSTLLINMNLTTSLSLIIQILLTISSTVLIFLILTHSSEDLLEDLIIVNDDSLRQSLRKSIKYIIILDGLLILVETLKLLAIYTNIDFIYNFANALSKESTAYALLYLPIILKYLATKPYRDIYISLKENEVIQ